MIIYKQNIIKVIERPSGGKLLKSIMEKIVKIVKIVKVVMVIKLET